MHPASFRLLLSTVLAYVLHFTDGCGRTPARTKPAATTPPPDAWRTTPDPWLGEDEDLHSLDCTKKEVHDAACLHGGECFALNLLDVRSAHCHCKEGWTGVRCERVDESFFVLQAEHIIAGSVAAGVALVVILATIIVAYLVIRRRKQRKARSQSGRVLSTNGNCPAERALISEKDKENNELNELQKCTDV